MQDEDYLLRIAQEEREKLFVRYEKGRNSGIEIDPWEDPGYEIYHQTDKYGFIHDKRLPQKKRVDAIETRHLQIQIEREKKWLHMLKRWNQRETKEKLHRRIYKGIPDGLRSAVWKKLLNVEKSIAENPNIYKNMLKLARTFSTDARQIDSDVNRQFREHIYYRERFSIKQRGLFNVLTAYSMYNMELGYCQGMAGVAGILLMYMDDEEAFWALNTFMIDKKYAMHGLFIDGFPKLTRFIAHHDVIVAKFLPRLFKHFKNHNVDSVLYSVKWFFVIFVERIPFSLCLRIWDIYILDGESICTAMAFTILRLHKKKLKMKDMDQMIEFLQCQLHKDFGYDDDYVIKELEQSLEHLKRSKCDIAPPPLDNEFPQQPLGKFIEPGFNTKIGRRKSFTEKQRRTREDLILRRQASINTDVSSNFSYEDADDNLANGSIRTYQSFNSLATSIAMSNGTLSSENSIISVISAEITRL